MKLSDNSFISSLFRKKEDINKYVFNNNDSNDIDLKKKYDIALVLGSSNRDILFKRCDSVIELYNSGIIKKIYLTGGVGFLSVYRSTSEASIMNEYILSKGIKEKDIFIEDKSRNTYENIINTINNIKKDDTIVLVTSDFHMKRSLGLLKKLTKNKVYSYRVLDSINDKDIWMKKGLKTRKLIRTECYLLADYVKKGLIDDQEVL